MSVKVSYREDRKKFEVTYYLDGVRKRPLFESKTEAKNFARKIQLGLAPEDRDSITIDEAGKKYFELISPKKCVKSRCNDKRYINLHFHFMTYERGIERLRSVQLEDMEAFRDWMPLQTEWDNRPMNMGPSTVNRCLRVMKNFYVKHIQWKSLEDTPCKYLEFLPTQKVVRPAMTSDQYELAYKKVPDWFTPIFKFIRLTGSPPSCAERLLWSDVNLQAKSYSFRRKKGHKANWRTIHFPMTDAVFALLVQIRNHSPEIEGAVFRDEEGRPMLADRICRIANDAIKEAGIKGVTLYGLRHALATDLTDANVATEIVRQAMGHMSISTTQGYANKVAFKSIAGALETVRGGSLVAVSDSELRTNGREKLS